MAVAYMPLGTLEELRDQVVEVALDRAFLLDPLPASAGITRRKNRSMRASMNLALPSRERRCSVRNSSRRRSMR